MKYVTKVKIMTTKMLLGDTLLHTIAIKDDFTELKD